MVDDESDEDTGTVTFIFPEESTPASGSPHATEGGGICSITQV